MKTMYIMCLLLMILLLACKDIQDSDNKKNANSDAISFLIDSTSILKNIVYIDIYGEIFNEKVKIIYYSIAEDIFFNALKNNRAEIKLFNKKHKINENFSYKNSLRNASVLRIDSFSFIDLPDSKKHYASFYFLENKLGKYFIIKKIEFEDEITIFWNSYSGKEEYFLQGLSNCSRSEDSLMFYCFPNRGYPISAAPIGLLKIKENKIDTLITVRTEWFTRYAFFDKYSSSIYYIHSWFDNFELKSTYAKMDLFIEN